MGKIIAIANQKGGVGKTTTTINVAASLAYRGLRVLCVDLDPQGNASSGLGVDKAHVPASTYDVLINSVPIDKAVVTTSMTGLTLVPSNIQLAGAEVELVSAASREYILKSALKPLAPYYDYILIDCPPSLGLLTLNALTAADRVMVPIQCEYYALEGVGQLMNTVQLAKNHLNPDLAVEGVVLTMLDGRTNLGMQVADEVRKYFRSKVYDTIIPRNVRLGEAPSFGLPIILYDARCIGAQAYLALADEIIERNGGKKA